MSETLYLVDASSIYCVCEAYLGDFSTTYMITCSHCGAMFYQLDASTVWKQWDPDQIPCG